MSKRSISSMHRDMVFLLFLTSTLVSPALGAAENSPSKRESMRMVFDPLTGKTLLYGGGIQVGGSWQAYSDLWSYDYATDTWAQITLNFYAPTKFLQSMAYLPDLQKIVLFGGWGGIRFDDTWIYDLNSKTWTQINPNTNPPARQSAAMAYDEENKKVVMFGGYGQNDIILGDTWVFDPSNNTWTEMKPAQKPLPNGAIGEYGSSMVYDSKNREIIMFGGHWVTKQGFGNSTDGYSNDIWVYNLDSNTWLKRDTSLKPTERYWLAATYDSNQGKLVIFGGFNGMKGTIRNDTWSYDYASNTWAEIETKTSPPSRFDTCMTYDPKNNKVILFGGITGSPPDFKTFGDTWALSYDGASGTWQQRAPVIDTSNQGTTPPGQIAAYPTIAIVIGLVITTLVLYEIAHAPRREPTT